MLGATETTEFGFTPCAPPLIAPPKHSAPVSAQPSATSLLPDAFRIICRTGQVEARTLNFPAQVMKIAPKLLNAGATVNEIESMPLPYAPKDLEDHY
jgi:hypothetical protein